MGKLIHFYKISLILIFFFAYFLLLPKQSLVNAERGCVKAYHEMFCYDWGPSQVNVKYKCEPCTTGQNCDNVGSDWQGMEDCDRGGGGGTSYISVSGIVKNKTTNTPIDGVRVHIFNSDMVEEDVITRNGGRFTSSNNKFPNNRDYDVSIPSAPSGFVSPKTIGTTAASSCLQGANQPVGSPAYNCQRVNGGCGQNCDFTLDVVSPSSSSSSSSSGSACTYPTDNLLCNPGAETAGLESIWDTWFYSGGSMAVVNDGAAGTSKSFEITLGPNILPWGRLDAIYQGRSPAKHPKLNDPANFAGKQIEWGGYYKTSPNTRLQIKLAKKENNSFDFNWDIINNLQNETTNWALAKRVSSIPTGTQSLDLNCLAVGQGAGGGEKVKCDEMFMRVITPIPCATNLVATCTSPYQVNLSWTAIPGAANTLVRVNNQSNGWQGQEGQGAPGPTGFLGDRAIGVTGPPANSVIVTPGVTYDWKVQGWKSGEVYVKGVDNGSYNCAQSGLNFTCPTPAPACSNKNQGDANCDGIIDDLDYQEWKEDYKNTREICSPGKRTDFNGDGCSTLIDFEIWRSGREESGNPRVSLFPTRD